MADAKKKTQKEQYTRAIFLATSIIANSVRIYGHKTPSNPDRISDRNLMNLGQMGGAKTAFCRLC